MAERPITIVAGLGRCGTSMVMQMLHAGGVPCVGQRPSFEVSRWQIRPTAEALAAIPGHAVKVLELHEGWRMVPPGCQVIWMDRDQREQAKSHAKFLRTMTGRHVDRSGRRALEASLMRDTHQTMGVIGSVPLVRLRFEDVLADPLKAARLLGEFTEHAGFNAYRAEQAVKRRSPECAPDLGIELSLTRDAMA